MIKKQKHFKISYYLDGLFYKGAGIGRYFESLTKEFAKRGIKIYNCVPNCKKSAKIDLPGPLKLSHPSSGFLI